MSALEELIAVIESTDEPNRSVDALIAIALHDKRGKNWQDSRDSSHARLPILEESPRPGQYEISRFSGVELKSAPEYTADDEAKRAAIEAIRAKQSDVTQMTQCPKCGLKAETLLHNFCTYTVCPVRSSLSHSQQGEG